VLETGKEIVRLKVPGTARTIIYDRVGDRD